MFSSGVYEGSIFLKHYLAVLGFQLFKTGVFLPEEDEGAKKLASYLI